MLDQKLRPWLLEINHSPSFATDTPFDEKVKYNLITDTFRLLNLDPLRKFKLKNKKRMEMQKRVYTGKQQKMTKEQKIQYKHKRNIKREKYERRNLGRYTLIYPDGVNHFINNYLLDK
jgi:tubulin polyglutamylase TTLL6/13